jgi:hypothetical protein
MDDEPDRLSNLCTDLVSLQRLEPSLLCLFQCKQAGEWTRVSELYDSAGGSSEPIRPELVAAWLPDPFGDADYAVIVFYDDATKWSFVAHYNKERLLHTAGRTQET